MFAIQIPKYHLNLQSAIPTQSNVQYIIIIKSFVFLFVETYSTPRHIIRTSLMFFSIFNSYKQTRARANSKVRFITTLIIDL